MQRHLQLWMICMRKAQKTNIFITGGAGFKGTEKNLVAYSDWRPGDQKVYVSDIRKAQQDFGWKPFVSPSQGIEKLIQWVRSNKNLF